GRGDLARIFRQLLGPAPDCNRLGDGVQVDHAIDAVVPVLQRDELRDGAEIIAEVQVAGRLHAGKHPLLERHARTLAVASPNGLAPRRGPKPAPPRRLPRGLPAPARRGRATASTARDCLEQFGRYSARAFWLGSFRWPRLDTTSSALATRSST